MICVVCSREISHRYIQDHWGNISHPDHFGREPDYCISCRRIISQKTSMGPSGEIGFRMKDGRKICGVCQATSVTRREDAEKSLVFVLKLLRKINVEMAAGKIEIILTDKLKLKAVSPFSVSCEGLCHSTIKEWSREIEVKSNIYILHGLPRVQFESILAHEVLHHWLHLHKIDLGQLTEGFCNIGSALVLNYYIASENNSLAALLRKFMNENQDFEYGIMYKELKSKLQAYGWKEFMRQIKTNSKK